MLDMRRPIPAALAVLTAVLLSASASAQTVFKAPDSVRLGLSVMSQVVASSGRLIAAGHYTELPAQANEIDAGIASLQRGLGEQPSSFIMKLTPLIAQLRVACGAMREAATHDRASMLPLVHDQLAEAVTSIIELFPENVRPAPLAARSGRR